MVAKRGKAAEPNAKTVPRKSKPVKEEEDEPVGPLSEEARKVRLQSTMIAFCLSIMVIGVGSTLLGYGEKSPFLIYGAAVLIGAVASGITWMILSKR